jgi:hypothetical protein
LRQLAAERNGIDAKVSGCRDDSVDGGIESQSLDDGVLASTGANDENLHGR